MASLQVFSTIVQNSGSSIIGSIFNLIFSTAKECMKFCIILLLMYSIALGIFYLGNVCSLSSESKTNVQTIRTQEKELELRPHWKSFNNYPYIIELSSKYGTYNKESKLSNDEWWFMHQ